MPILAALKFLLNPMNWGKILSLLLSIREGIKLVQDYLAKRRLEKRKEEIDAAINDALKANEVQDEQSRLKAKAHAAKNLECIADPDSCDKL
jgi:ABC-type phosphate transport system auxiliary subunit